MRPILVALTRAATLLLPALAGAQQTGAALPEAVARYEAEIRQVLNAPGPSSLEPAFEAGLAAADRLVAGIEDLDQAVYRRVQQQMHGFFVHREEVVVAAPDAAFFQKLAREKGTPTDRAFFEALSRTYPDGYWPGYSQNQTDYGGCTVFDGKTLTGIYQSWVAFRNANPRRYRAAVQRELERIEHALASTCVCGGAAEYRTEREGFRKLMRRAAPDPATPPRFDCVAR